MSKVKNQGSFLIILFLLPLTWFSFSCAKECKLPDRCSWEPEPGPCLAAIPKYYYDPQEKRCLEFIWGGCNGTVPYESLEECEQQCRCDN